MLSQSQSYFWIADITLNLKIHREQGFCAIFVDLKPLCYACCTSVSEIFLFLSSIFQEEPNCKLEIDTQWKCSTRSFPLHNKDNWTSQYHISVLGMTWVGYWLYAVSSILASAHYITRARAVLSEAWSCYLRPSARGRLVSRGMCPGDIAPAQFSLMRRLYLHSWAWFKGKIRRPSTEIFTYTGINKAALYNK